MHNFRELNIWRDALELASEIFSLTKKFPAEERYGLISQINRSAVSVPSNIAEGSSRKSNKDFYRFLEIALGSCFELETQLIIAEKCRYITDTECQQGIDKVQRLQKMIFSFKDKIQNQTQSS